MTFQITLDLESKEARKYLRNLKVRWRQCLVTSIPSRNNTLVIVAKHFGETNVKNVLEFPFFVDFFTLSHQFFRDCSFPFYSNFKMISRFFSFRSILVEYLILVL